MGKGTGLSKNRVIYIEPLQQILRALFQVNIRKMAKHIAIYILQFSRFRKQKWDYEQCVARVKVKFKIE